MSEHGCWQVEQVNMSGDAYNTPRVVLCTLGSSEAVQSSRHKHQPHRQKIRHTSSALTASGKLVQSFSLTGVTAAVTVKPGIQLFWSPLEEP